MQPPEIWFYQSADIWRVEATAAAVEAEGFDGLVMTDSQNLSPDVWVALTLAARATSTLKLGTGVTNPVTRHPAVTASLATSLNEVSEGRAVLGIGRGDSALFNIGRRAPPARDFGEAVAAIGRYLGGEAVDQAGVESRIRWLARCRHPRPPLEVVGTGPKVLAVGARHAERVSFAVGADPRRIREAARLVRASIPGGRTAPSLGAYVNVCVHDDVERAAELVRAGVGIFAHFTGMSEASLDAVEAGDRAAFVAIDEGYERAKHGRSDAAHARALPAAFIERFAVVGPAERCAERLRSLLDAGLDRLVVIGPSAVEFGDEALAARRAFVEGVMPRLRRGGHGS